MGADQVVVAAATPSILDAAQAISFPASAADTSGKVDENVGLPGVRNTVRARAAVEQVAHRFRLVPVEQRVTVAATVQPVVSRSSAQGLPPRHRS